jgi:coenzyme Q-binding protein COQ10
MASAQTTEVFNCTPKEFYDLVSDFEKYPEFLNEVKKVKILKKTGTTLEMEYTVSVLKTFSYKLTAELKEPSSVKFHYTSGDVFKSMNGSWDIKPEGKDKCKVHYNVEANFGLLVPGAVAKTLVSVNLPMMIVSFKNRIKKVYGK